MDRGNSSVEYDEQGKIKTQNSSGSSAAALAISSNSAGGSVDSAGASVTGSNSAGGGAGGEMALNDMLAGQNSEAIKGNSTTIGSAAVGAAGAVTTTEVDEDGYSIQPPKEVAWDENNENGKKKDFSKLPKKSHSIS